MSTKKIALPASDNSQFLCSSILKSYISNEENDCFDSNSSASFLQSRAQALITTKEQHHPVISGDLADPSILHVGNIYYATGPLIGFTFTKEQ